ncbi:hypothetical protein ABZY14_11725 [Streptomyces sp. NPDC006617]|uniref:hypothetical protein n=1 Tax=Streptomyces sp. NPDC006617 TaxID=3155354 RepID=UPI0033A19E9E
MRPSSLHSPWARAAVAGAAAAGLAAAGLAGVAHAADDQVANGGAPLPVTITGPDRVGLALDGAEDEPGEPQIRLGLTGPGEEPDGDTEPQPLPNNGYEITVDATALKGFAKVTLPKWCEAEGLVAVCRESTLYPGSSYNPSWKVRLDLKDTAEAGDHGTIKVTGKGEGLEFNEHTVDVLVGGPELLKKKLPAEPAGFRPGDTYRAPLGFRNVGSVPAHGVVLRFAGTRGLSFPESYDNCSYAEEHKDNLIRYRQVALCTFEGEFLHGMAYELSEPVKVKTADFALGDIFTYGFDAVGAEAADALRSGAGHRQGTGRTLTLEPVESGHVSDYSKYAEIDLPTQNTYDLDLTGARVAGEQGETVTVDVRMSNHGPAWIGSLRAGGEPLGFSVQIPEGASVVDSPCRPVNDETPDVYRCFADTPFLEDDARTFPFKLRIDKVVAGAKGKIALPEYDNPWEGDPSNDTGWIVLNGTGDEETPGDTGGSTGGPDSTGGTGSTGGSQTTGGTGTTGGSDTAGGTTGGTATAGTSGGTSGASTGGQSPQGGAGGVLASTGSTVLLGSAGAALALAAGGVLYVVSRRRRTGGTTA